MNWIELTNELQISELKENSLTRPQLIFKHSTRCSISSVAKNRLENVVSPNQIDFYYLDLIKYRAISDKIASTFDVFHESPQILLIKNKECVYDDSHSGISMDDIVEQAAL